MNIICFIKPTQFSAKEILSWQAELVIKIFRYYPLALLHLLLLQLHFIKFIFKKKKKDICFLKRNIFSWACLVLNQRRSQNSKQVPQNFMKVFNIDGAASVLRLMTSYRRLDIASEKEVNWRVASLTNQSCQISIIVEERLVILVIIHFFSISKTRPSSYQKCFTLKLVCREVKVGSLYS